MQALQVPLPSQTMLVPQPVPADLLVAATHWDDPVEQEVVPFWQGLLGWQETPELHVLQVPLPSQTLLVPQFVPAAWLPVPAHTAVPVEQDTLPVWQRLLLGLQALPSGQAPQVPLLQNCPLPQLLPLSAGTHVPVEQELQLPQVV